MSNIVLFIFTLLVLKKIVADVTDISTISTNIAHFICGDGTVVEKIRVCNGLPDCPDSSDELTKVCHHFECPGWNYRCSYGACVQKTARCDGYEDCVDGSDEFRCDFTDTCTDRDHICAESLECIPLNKTCDGYVECADGSDETETLCKEYPCPLDAYHCAYGGCVHQETICDGVNDCADGSDESTSVCHSIICQGPGDISCASGGQCIPTSKICDGSYDCRDESDEAAETCAHQECSVGSFRCNTGECIDDITKCHLQPSPPALSNGGCQLPPLKPATHYFVSTCPECLPGQVVRELTRLDYFCDLMGHLEGSSTVYCRNCRWTPTEPTCIYEQQDISCPPIDAPGAKKHCEVLWGPRTGWIACNGSIPVGTRVSLECPDFYERQRGSTHTTCLHDGTWSQIPLRCRPNCGLRETSVAALIIKGWELDPEESPLPWHATLFSHDDGRWNFFCGGTLVSERAVVTAGHCVWRTDEKTIKIALAAFSSNFTDQNEKTQIFGLDRIELQTSYQDHVGNYGSDLAILILDRPAMINSAVMPICLNWSNSIDELQKSQQIGLVAGMGITDNDTFSSKLRVTSVQLVPENKCREYQKKDFWKYITYTSFCAGWLNGTAVCNGDSGGGLAFRRPDSTIWDLYGVVSISPRRIGTSICDPHYYTVFTKVVVYSDWIKQILKTLPIIGPPDTELPPNRDVLYNY